jgi:hypothetical protein
MVRDLFGSVDLSELPSAEETLFGMFKLPNRDDASIGKLISVSND